MSAKTKPLAKPKSTQKVEKKPQATKPVVEKSKVTIPSFMEMFKLATN